MLAITRHRRWILQLIRQAGFWTGDIFHTANISACRFSWVLSSGPRSCVLKCPALLAQCQLGHTCRKWRVKCVCPCFILTQRERCLFFFYTSCKIMEWFIRMRRLLPSLINSAAPCYCWEWERGREQGKKNKDRKKGQGQRGSRYIPPHTGDTSVSGISGHVKRRMGFR